MASFSDVLFDLCLGEGIRPSLILASSMLEFVFSNGRFLNLSDVDCCIDLVEMSPDFGLLLFNDALDDALKSETRLAMASSFLPLADNVLLPMPPSGPFTGDGELLGCFCTCCGCVLGDAEEEGRLPD